LLPPVLVAPPDPTLPPVAATPPVPGFPPVDDAPPLALTSATDESIVGEESPDEPVQPPAAAPIANTITKREDSMRKSEVLSGSLGELPIEEPTLPFW
jgi:hypothetical protein